MKIPMLRQVIFFLQAKKRYQIHLKSDDGQIYVLLINKDAENENPFVTEVPLPKDVQLVRLSLVRVKVNATKTLILIQTDDAENEDPSGGTRRVGRKAKAASEVTSTPPASKKVKTEDDTDAAEAEVERILSNKILDTNIPELDDMMTAGSKFCCLISSLADFNAPNFFFSVWATDETESSPVGQRLLLQFRRQRRSL